MLFKTETEIINEICVVYEKTFFKLFQFFFPIFFVPLLAVGLASSTMGPFSFRASNLSFLSYYTDIISFLQFCEHQENMVRPFVQRCFFHLISSWRISKKKCCRRSYVQFGCENSFGFWLCEALYCQFCTRSSYFELLLLSLALFHSKFFVFCIM